MSGWQPSWWVMSLILHSKWQQKLNITTIFVFSDQLTHLPSKLSLVWCFRASWCCWQYVMEIFFKLGKEEEEEDSDLRRISSTPGENLLRSWIREEDTKHPLMRLKQTRVTLKQWQQVRFHPENPGFSLLTLCLQTSTVNPSLKHHQEKYCWNHPKLHQNLFQNLIQLWAFLTWTQVHLEMFNNKILQQLKQHQQQQQHRNQHHQSC